MDWTSEAPEPRRSRSSGPPWLASRLTGRTVVGSAYKGAWMGLPFALVLLIVDPWSEVAVGGAIAACFIGGALAAAIVHRVVRRPAGRRRRSPAARRLVIENEEHLEWAERAA